MKAYTDELRKLGELSGRMVTDSAKTLRRGSEEVAKTQESTAA